MSDLETDNEVEKQKPFYTEAVLKDEDQRKEVIDLITSEIETAKSEREPFLKKVDKWRRQREGRPEEEVKNFPWKKASNVCIPLAKTNTNGIAASMKAAFDQKRPFFHVEGNNESNIPAAEALKKYLNLIVESKFHLNLRSVLGEMLFDLVSFGTQFVSVPWIEDVMQFKRKGATGGLETVSVTRRKGPGVVPIMIEDFYCRQHVTDLQTAEWLAIRHNLTWHELKQREAQGIFEGIDRIKDDYRSKQDDNREDEAVRQGFDPSDAKLYEIFEVYVFTDIDDDGVAEDIKLWIELESRTILREEVNDLGVRSVVRITYIPYPNRLYGEGVGQMTEHLQDAMDALFNMAVNSTHVSSLQMFATRRGSNIGPEEEFRPLKQFEMDNPREDIFPLVFPNTAMPNMSMMGFVKQFADEVGGAGNSFMGQPDAYAKTRATASGTMFLAQQKSRLFNSAVANVEEGFSQVGALVVFQSIRNKGRVDTSLLGPEQEELLRQIFNLKVEDIHLNFAFSISSTKVEQTEEARRQAILTLSQLYNMYGQQTLTLLTSMMQVAQQTGQPQAATPFMQKYFEFGQQFIVGSQTLMGKVLEFFTMEKKGMLPYVKDIEMMLEMMTQVREMNMTGGGNGPRAIGETGGAVQGAGGGYGNTGGAGAQPADMAGAPGNVAE
jgi:hypothetical protein